VSGRVLFYVQHLLGVGHLKRAAILADAMAAAGLDVTVALGGAKVPEVRFSGARCVQLPPTGIARADFSTLVDADGAPVDEAWKARRRDALLDLYRRAAPDVILLELFPFGRRQFRFELIPLLEAVHADKPRPRVACSVRDILVASKAPGRAEETAGIVRHCFDAVLVHGDPRVAPISETFAATGEIADLIRHTGYVCEPEAGDAPAEGHGEVIVSAGGGAVGAPLLFAAAAARPMTALAGAVWRFLTGPNLPEDDYSCLVRLADDGTIVERFRPDLGARLKTCALSISQAGYNTTMDILRARASAVMVPFEAPGETEQRRRADLLARRGLLTVVPADRLSPHALAAAIAAALARPRPVATDIDLSGAATTARLVAGLAARRY
jgi:predicted glycosyltransferase